MNYIVLDLEWNQPFSPRSMITKPVRLQGEIIQIGAVKLNEHLEIVDTFKVMVKPKYYRTMHRKVSKLTNISNEDLEYGFPFKQALTYFTAWCPEDAIFLTWGGDDVKMLHTNISVHKIKGYHLPKSHNVQKLFSRQIVKDTRQYSLVQAMEILQEPACSAHDALHDSMNTARILRHLDLSVLLNDDTQNNLPDNDDGYQELCEDAFASRLEAFTTLQEKVWTCPNCAHHLFFEPWVKQNNEKRIAVATCDCGCSYFARVRIRKSDNKYRCNRIVYPLTEELVSFYNEHRDIELSKAERHAEYEAIRMQVCAC